MSNPIKIGSEAHKELFCQSFIASHREYKLETLAWPEFDTETLDRLRKIPFWDEAFKTERKAGVMINAYAQTISDSLLREAIALYRSSVSLGKSRSKQKPKSFPTSRFEP